MHVVGTTRESVAVLTRALLLLRLLIQAGAGALPVPSPHGLPPTAHGTHFGKGAGSGAHEGAREPALVLEPIGKLEVRAIRCSC